MVEYRSNEAVVVSILRRQAEIAVEIVVLEAEVADLEYRLPPDAAVAAAWGQGLIQRLDGLRGEAVGLAASAA